MVIPPSSRRRHMGALSPPDTRVVAAPADLPPTVVALARGGRPGAVRGAQALTERHEAPVDAALGRQVRHRRRMRSDAWAASNSAKAARSGGWAAQGGALSNGLLLAGDVPALPPDAIEHRQRVAQVTALPV